MIMGKWFPDIRKGTKEQVSEYRDAQKAQFRNSNYESKAGMRFETPWYHQYNDRTNIAADPLSRTQQNLHFQRALTEYDREATQLQRAADKQTREQPKKRETPTPQHRAADKQTREQPEKRETPTPQHAPRRRRRSR